MTPTTFPQSNIVIAKDQPEYIPLPACVCHTGVVISCWALSKEEVNQIAESQLLWLKQLTFGQPLQPLVPQVENPFEDKVPEVQLYRHYKGGIYRVVSEATSTDTKAPVIVYCSLVSGQMFVRDKVEFSGVVEVPGRGKIPRFERM